MGPLQKSILLNLITILEARGYSRNEAVRALKQLSANWWCLKAKDAWDVAYKFTGGGGVFLEITKEILDIIFDKDIVNEVWDIQSLEQRKNLKKQ